MARQQSAFSNRCKITNRIPSFFRVFFLLVFSQVSVASEAEISYVMTESLAVKTDMSESSAVLENLKKGDAVTVELEIIGAEGVWCWIRMDDGKKGFVRCEHLKRVEAPTKKWQSVEPSNEEALSSAEKQVISGRSESKKGTKKERMPKAYMPYTWAGVLGFSTKQMKQIDALIDRTGVDECYEKSVEYLNQSGPPIPILHPDVHIGAMACEQDYPLHAICKKRIEKFWKAFPTIMTPEQRNKFEEALVPGCR